MIAEAIEKILSLAVPKLYDIGGNAYSNKELTLIPPPEFQPPEVIELATLQGLVDYVKAEPAPARSARFVTVSDHNMVDVCGELMPANSNRRFWYAVAICPNQPHPFGEYLNLEEFIVSLQSSFVADDNIYDLLAVVGNLADEKIVDMADDGIHQTVQIKSGITTKSPTVLTNPITLQPYRTFREVEQPRSDFVIRIKTINGEMKCALFSADGGSWKISAIENIKAWLQTQIDIDNVTVIG
jgi:hypothetical protein